MSKVIVISSEKMKTYAAIIEYMGMLDAQPIFLSSISSLKPITFVP